MPTVMSAIVYSSSDDASSDGGISDWNDQLEENRNLLDESGEEQSEENQVVQTIGRPKKQMAAVDPPMAVELLSSQKKMKDGRSSYLAILEGEVFQRYSRADAAGIQKWRCIKHSEGCKKVIATNQANMCIRKNVADHSHCTAKVDLDIRKFKRQIPILSTQDQVAPRQIYSNLIEFASRKVAALVNPLNVSQVVNYHRRKEDADPRLIANPEVMVVPEELQHYKNNLFVIYDSGPSPRRIMIFSTPALLRFLEDSEWWGFDGTFALLPKGWKQLLTLHAKLGETFVPCLHALLPKKSRTTYDHFFSAVKHLIPNARVGHAHMDYERGLISAFEHSNNFIYSGSKTWLFCPLCSSAVQKLGLVQVYKQEGRFSVLFDALKSLVYVPPGDVPMAYEAILNQCARNLEGSNLGGSYRRKINVSNKPLELLCFDCGRQIKDNEFSRGLAQLSKIGSCKFRWKETSVLEMAEKLEARMQYDGSAACLNAWNSKETEA
uniref:FLYWCH-type domain-containing protein n=1 Tax=Ditylenchus dipsaci TaxID=166011 RepID=A0A915CNQ8_9BILA